MCKCDDTIWRQLRSLISARSALSVGTVNHQFQVSTLEVPYKKSRHVIERLSYLPVWVFDIFPKMLCLPFTSLAHSLRFKPDSYHTILSLIHENDFIYLLSTWQSRRYQTPSDPSRPVLYHTASCSNGSQPTRDVLSTYGSRATASWEL
jgi:hypothetical protein